MKLIVFDLEATCWENASSDQKDQMETIEIGAVETDAEFNPTGREFQAFIKPVATQYLSDFCKSLTSITQEQVDGAEYFGTVFRNFLEWAEFPKNRFISWGHYDYNQLDKDCKRAAMEMFDKRFHKNGKELFKDYTGRMGKGLGTELKKRNIKFQGTAHRGIDDARMISKLLWSVYKK